jgi:hypothetical protein
MFAIGKLNPRTDVLPFVAATAGEFAALFYWLRLLEAGQPMLAAAVLWAGFSVERIAVALWIVNVYAPKDTAAPPRPPLWQSALTLVAITVSEVLIWVAWYALALQFGHLLAGVVLMGLMLAEHSVEMSLIKRTPPFAFMANRETIFFTVMEVAGAVGWLYLTWNGQPLAGAACLLIGLSVEHILQGAQLKPAETAAPVAVGVQGV